VSQFLIDHAIGHPVHVVEKRGDSNWDSAGVDGVKHGAVNQLQLAVLKYQQKLVLNFIMCEQKLTMRCFFILSKFSLRRYLGQLFGL
jgi:hypothetical protein